MADSFFKKENNKKKTLIKKQKAQKRQDRKTNNNKGKGFESMIVYVDANGHFTSSAPEKQGLEHGKKTGMPEKRMPGFRQNDAGAEK